MKRVTVIRCVLELTSPLAIGAGTSSDLSDAVIFTDASGLPMIPGTSLAGVLRAAWQELYGKDAADALFGKTHRHDAPEAQDLDACLNISCGVLHDHNDLPVRPCQPATDMSDFARAARSVMSRQHVRINERGAAAKRGLYDRDMVPKGHRFTVELRLDWPDPTETSERNIEPQDIPLRLLALLHSPLVSLGARSRSGLGQFVVQRAAMRTFDLTKQQDFEAYCSLPVALWQAPPPSLLKPVDLTTLSLPQLDGWVTLTLELRPRKSWLIAGGTPTEQDQREKKPADRIPWREPRVRWKRNTPTFSPEELELAVPASSLKGPLRHRTAFYLNAAQGHFAEKLSREEREALDAQNNQQLWTLFGGVDLNHAAERDPELRDKFAGKIIMEDAELLDEGKHGFQDHVTLDRFTGGALSGHLFDESLCWGGSWRVRLHIRDPHRQVPKVVRQAFQRALEDLRDGCLQIGAGDARGHGRMDLTALHWSDQGAWLNAEDPKDSKEFST